VHRYLQLARVALAPRDQIRFLPIQPAQFFAEDSFGFGLRHHQPHLPEMAVELLELLLLELPAANAPAPAQRLKRPLST
jgi:hypothetical protein